MFTGSHLRSRKSTGISSRRSGEIQIGFSAVLKTAAADFDPMKMGIRNVDECH
jgi:hypothetical protein